MSRLEVLLSSQHSLSESSKHAYRCAVNKFESLTEASFESVYEASKHVQDVLA